MFLIDLCHTGAFFSVSLTRLHFLGDPNSSIIRQLINDDHILSLLLRRLRVNRDEFSSFLFIFFFFFFAMLHLNTRFYWKYFVILLIIINCKEFSHFHIMAYIFFALNLFKNNKYCFFPIKSQIAQLFYLKFHSSILKGCAYLGNNF